MIDRYLPFNFEIELLSGRQVGIVDHISLKPKQIPSNFTQYDEQFVVATLDSMDNAEKSFLLKRNIFQPKVSQFKPNSHSLNTSK